MPVFRFAMLIAIAAIRRRCRSLAAEAQETLPRARRSTSARRHGAPSVGAGRGRGNTKTCTAALIGPRTRSSPPSAASSTFDRDALLPAVVGALPAGARRIALQDRRHDRRVVPRSPDTIPRRPTTRLKTTGRWSPLAAPLPDQRQEAAPDKAMFAPRPGRRDGGWGAQPAAAAHRHEARSPCRSARARAAAW